jgi:Type III restriction enzyme, res subunit
MKLEQALVLNRFLGRLFGVDEFAALKPILERTQEGPAGDGQTHFFHALAGLKNLHVSEPDLARYDAQVIGYEHRLGLARGGIRFKYFQYLCALYTEIFLDRVTAAPEIFVRDLNGFLASLRSAETAVATFPEFLLTDLRRLAFFMATGSGKTLLMHVNLWQILHYLERGRHPEALVDRADRRAEFESVVLVTPNEGLSQQHLDEFRRSGIEAVHLTRRRVGTTLIGTSVGVVEIHKLTEEPSREGVSIVLEELGQANLVFVDEGHKGTGSEARTWKNRQKALSSRGFLVEYSATFAQAIGAASRAARQGLIEEYGKSILFDYSYRHFYDDGYGKDFRVLNVARARHERAPDLLLGGLLAFYRQLRLFREREAAFVPYGLEQPLWVFLGSSVNALYVRDGTRQSDVTAVVSFLKRFLEDEDWAVARINQLLRGDSGFIDAETRKDLFLDYLGPLVKTKPVALYREICGELFHGRGALEVWELKGAEGELGLRVSSPARRSTPYFGVINIGDAAAFRKHLGETLGRGVREDRFAVSLFSGIARPDSTINILIGSKKFIEGWSSWRVSAMGLLNIGRGEGPQVIQLFGRGVRLRGRRDSLKRSGALPDETPHPTDIEALETLLIFGWNANYIEAFRKILAEEDLGREVVIPTRPSFAELPELLAPSPRSGYVAGSETWVLAAEPPWLKIDFGPKITAFSGTTETSVEFSRQRTLDFGNPQTLGLLNLEALHSGLLEYKALRGYGNVFVPRAEVSRILASCSITVSDDDLGNAETLQIVALRVLTIYLDRFAARKEREAEARELEPAPWTAREEYAAYNVRVTDEALLGEIQALVRDRRRLESSADTLPLPRIHFDRHLFNPILLSPADYRSLELRVKPQGLRKTEKKFLEDLRTFWAAQRDRDAYRHLEIFVVRNLPRIGVGFFRRSGFYPDFIVWLRGGRSGETTVLFVEPHGMHHGGLSGNQDKIEAFRELRSLAARPAFRGRAVRLAGCIVTETPRDDIPGAEAKTWEELEREYGVFEQQGPYIEKILALT